jgi:glycosyltransferase involved in cell wall biosynthesis
VAATIRPPDERASLNAQTPDVSFVVIGYNESANVAHCLASIFAQQGLGSYEVVVVDDASSDPMAEVVREVERDHPVVRLIRHAQNLGRGAARRTGQDASLGTRVAFIDADIRLPDDWLVRVRQGLSSADAISGIAIPDGDVAVIWRIFGPIPKSKPSDWQLTGNNVMITREALDLVGWPAARRRSEDNRMARAMVDAGLRVSTDPSIVVEHHEAKTYRRTLRHVYGTGFHANEILRDLRRVRLPDLVWVGWVLVIACGVALAAVGTIPWWSAAAGVALVTLLVDAAAMSQRFYFWRAPLRWVAATCANLPMIAAYLVSRTLSAPRLLLARSPDGT